MQPTFLRFQTLGCGSQAEHVVLDYSKAMILLKLPVGEKW